MEKSICYDCYKNDSCMTGCQSVLGFGIKLKCKDFQKSSTLSKKTIKENRVYFKLLIDTWNNQPFGNKAVFMNMLAEITGDIPDNASNTEFNSKLEIK